MTKLVAVLLAAAALAVPAAASANPPLLGIKGDVARFQTLTGQDSQVRHVIVAWGQGLTWGSQFPALFQQLGGIPMIGLSTGARGGGEAITPQQIAQGKGDAYLIALNAAVNGWGQEIYIRPFGEMNGYWNKYCAYTKSGARQAGPPDELVPEGVRTRLPDRPRRRGRRHRREADEARDAAARRRRRPAGEPDADDAGRLEPAGLRRARTSRGTRPRRTTRATPTSTSSATISTTSTERRSGMLPKRCTRRIPGSRSRSRSGGCGGSTTRCS